MRWRNKLTPCKLPLNRFNTTSRVQNSLKIKNKTRDSNEFPPYDFAFPPLYLLSLLSSITQGCQVYTCISFSTSFFGLDCEQSPFSSDLMEGVHASTSVERRSRGMRETRAAPPPSGAFNHARGHFLVSLSMLELVCENVLPEVHSFYQKALKL